MSHSNSVKKKIDSKLDATILASPNREDHDGPSRPPCLIPEYVNICISVLRKSRRVQEKYKNGNSIPKVFGLISIFVSMDIYVTKFILPETDIF